MSQRDVEKLLGKILTDDEFRQSFFPVGRHSFEFAASYRHYHAALMNVVLTGRGLIVEIQGTAERRPFTQQRLDELLALAAVDRRRPPLLADELGVAHAWCMHE